MTVRIEAGSIIQDKALMWRRFVVISSDGDRLVDKTVYAKTREELEIIDHEDFETEDRDLNIGIYDLKHTEFKHDKIMIIS